MRVAGATRAHLQDAGDSAGVEVLFVRGSGTSWHIKLRRLTERWQKMDETYTDARGHTTTLDRPVCWHGHVAFMRAVFARAPDATIRSALATYRGMEDFEKRYRGTANLQKQTCTCDQPGLLKRLVRIK